MDRSYRRPQKINYQLIADAEAYYTQAGYTFVPVPWVVSDEAYHATMPEGVKAYKTLGGNLVASGEQSFIHMMLSGKTLGKTACTTPCFRDEVHDDTHDPYFMKTELIVTGDTSKHSLAQVVADAQDFYAQYTSVNVVALPDGTFDIEHETTGIELGSYGVRSWGGFEWIYGTGVAEPRLSKCIAADNR